MNICELERFRCNDSALPLQCRSSHRQHVSLPVSINLCLWTLNGEIYTVFKGRKILPLTLSQLLKNVKPFIGHGLNKHRRQAGFNPLAGCGLLTLALDQCFLFFFLLVVLHAACGNFVARPGMEPVPPAVEAWGLNCRTTSAVPAMVFQLWCLDGLGDLWDGLMGLYPSWRRYNTMVCSWSKNFSRYHLVFF